MTNLTINQETSTAPVVEIPENNDLALQIKELNIQLDQTEKTWMEVGKATLDLYLALGEKLSQLKAETPRGEWCDVRAGLGLQERRAQRAVQLHKHRETLGVLNMEKGGLLTLTEALDAIATKKPAPEPSEPSASLEDLAELVAPHWLAKSAKTSGQPHRVELECLIPNRHTSKFFDTPKSCRDWWVREGQSKTELIVIRDRFPEGSRVKIFKVDGIDESFLYARGTVLEPWQGNAAETHAKLQRDDVEGVACIPWGNLVALKPEEEWLIFSESRPCKVTVNEREYDGQAIAFLSSKDRYRVNYELGEIELPGVKVDFTRTAAYTNFLQELEQVSNPAPVSGSDEEDEEPGEELGEIDQEADEAACSVTIAAPAVVPKSTPVETVINIPKPAPAKPARAVEKPCRAIATLPSDCPVELAKIILTLEIRVGDRVFYLGGEELEIAS